MATAAQPAEAAWFWVDIGAARGMLTLESGSDEEWLRLVICHVHLPGKHSRSAGRCGH
jgi:hypothetical protein